MSLGLTTRLLLVRHAESVANADGRLQGSGDAPLSPRGEEQARRLAAWLRDSGPPADVLVSSPLQRARQTAEAISGALGMELLIRPGLREANLGNLEGADAQTLAAVIAAGGLRTEDGAETPRAFVERTIGALHGLLAAYEGQTLIVVTHGGVIATALAHWLDRNVTRWTLYGAVRNAAVNELVFGAQVELVRQDDVAHLT